MGTYAVDDVSIHRLVNAAQVEPLTGAKYLVACVPHPEFTLRVGDIVRIVVDPSHHNWLLRESDYTLHDLCREGNYITLAKR